MFSHCSYPKLKNLTLWNRKTPLLSSLYSRWRHVRVQRLGAPSHTAEFLYLYVLSLLVCALSDYLQYGKTELLKIGNHCQDYTFENLNSIPMEIQCPAEPSGIIIIPPAGHRRRCKER